jgi:hypothetical protein
VEGGGALKQDISSNKFDTSSSRKREKEKEREVEEERMRKIDTKITETETSVEDTETSEMNFDHLAHFYEGMRVGFGEHVCVCVCVFVSYICATSCLYYTNCDLMYVCVSCCGVWCSPISIT